ncbi:MAG TPA: hypothetical protein VFV50_19495 [Bdellovibrionales bacterium]|nr:hypothetical protein [Bdellovibrionales bacterium]
MIRLARVLLFVLASIVEVQVRAAIVMLPNQDVVLQEPADCLFKESMCAMKTKPGHKFETKIGSTSLILGSDTIIVRTAQDSLLLVQGEVWVKAAGEFHVRSEYGEVKLNEDGEAWFVRGEKRVLVRTLREGSVVIARNSQEHMLLLQGFEIAMEGVTASGHGRLSVPTVINFRDHLRRWARLYRGPKKEFVNELQRFEPVLREAAIQSSDLHVEMAKRRIASEQAELDRQLEEQRRIERENARLRKLFRDRLER